MVFQRDMQFTRLVVVRPTTAGTPMHKMVARCSEIDHAQVRPANHNPCLLDTAAILLECVQEFVLHRLGVRRTSDTTVSIRAVLNRPSRCNFDNELTCSSFRLFLFDLDSWKSHIHVRSNTAHEVVSKPSMGQGR